MVTRSEPGKAHNPPQLSTIARGPINLVTAREPIQERKLDQIHTPAGCSVGRIDLSGPGSAALITSRRRR